MNTKLIVLYTDDPNLLKFKTSFATITIQKNKTKESAKLPC